MNRENTATFIGHRVCDADPKAVRERIVELIEKWGVTDFLDGGMGQSDLMCAQEAHDLNKTYPAISLHLVIPYPSFNIKTGRELFDDVIYPQELGAFSFRRAIVERNKYLVENSAHAVCYVTHSEGGAARTYDNAKRLKLHIIDVGEGFPW